MKDAVDLLNDQLTVARNEFAAYRCKVEAQIEVLELTIGRLRCVCDAAFTVVREDGDEDGWTAAWQELVSALEDARYEPDYLTCPDWIAGNGTVSSLTFTTATCGYSLGHRTRHQCDCVCVRPAGHDGPHQCSAEAVRP